MESGTARALWEKQFPVGPSGTYQPAMFSDLRCFPEFMKEFCDLRANLHREDQAKFFRSLISSDPS
jgi:hypothetical protein